MIDTKFYVGPLGDLIALPDATRTVDTVLQIIGGNHTSLTGTVTRDVFGLKRSLSWAFPGLLAPQQQWIEALNRALVRGPLYLIDPRRPNRLPEQTASGGSVFRTPDAFIPSNNGVCYWRAHSQMSLLDQMTLPARMLTRGGLEWALLDGTGGALELAGLALDGRLNVPVLPSEPLECSAWLAGPAGATVTLTATVYDRGGNQVATGTASLSPSPTSWSALAVPITVPATGAYLRLGFGYAGPAGSVFATALSVARSDDPELTPGLQLNACGDVDVSGGWRVGGGGPCVVVTTDNPPTSYIAPGLASSALSVTER